MQQVLFTIQTMGVCVTSSLVNYSGVPALTFPCNVELQDCYTFMNWTEWGWTSSDARSTSPFGWIRPCTCSVFSIHLNSPCIISSCTSGIMNRLVWPCTPSRSDSNCSTQKTVSPGNCWCVLFITFQVQLSEVTQANRRCTKDKTSNNEKQE